MNNIQKDKTTIEDYFVVSNNIYQNLLGYKPEQTALISLDKLKWRQFCKKWALNEYSDGVYLPRNQTAVIQKEIETASLGLFHEYFGHGLFCEQSLQGKRLVNLERKLLEKEKKCLGRQFNLRDIEKFRRQNILFKELNKLKEENLGLYENFAIFSEFILSKDMGLQEIFEKKYDKLYKEDKNQIDKIISFNKEYGALSTFYSFGLARKTDVKRINQLLNDIYKNKLADIKLAVLYGSKKPFSDIDIFMVSNNLNEINSSWLDIRIYSEKEFENGIEMFDISITDPVLSGEFVLGG